MCFEHMLCLDMNTKMETDEVGEKRIETVQTKTESANRTVSFGDHSTNSRVWGSNSTETDSVNSETMRKIKATEDKIEAEYALKEAVSQGTCNNLRKKSMQLLDDRHKMLHVGNTQKANSIMGLIKRLNPLAFVKAAKMIKHRIRRVSTSFGRRQEEEEEEESASNISDDTWSAGGGDDLYLFAEEESDDLDGGDDDDGGDNDQEDDNAEENIDEIIANEANKGEGQNMKFRNQPGLAENT